MESATKENTQKVNYVIWLNMIAHTNYIWLNIAHKLYMAKYSTQKSKYNTHINYIWLNIAI